MGNSERRFSLSMVPFVPWAVYNVAEHKGFWKRHGIDVTVVVHSTEEAYVEAVSADHSDFYPLPLASMLDFINTGIDLVYLGVLDLGNGHKHLIMKTGFLGQPLKGETIALYSDECTTRYLVARYLQTRGLMLSDVNLEYTEAGVMSERFVRGDLKVVLAFRDNKEQLQSDGDGTVVFTTADYPDAFGITTSRRRLEGFSPEDLKRFYRGRFDALEWLSDPANRDEFNSIVNSVTFNGFPQLSASDIQAQLAEVRVPGEADLSALNRNDLPDIFRDFREVVIRNGILERQNVDGFTYDQIVHNRGLIEALSPG